MQRRILLILFFVNVCFCGLYAQVSSELQVDRFEARLSQLESVHQVKKLKGNTYQIEFRQPIDHDKPIGETFTQRMYLTHKDFDAPMVMVTEGYAAPRPYSYELSGVLAANQLIVEHRYFGESAPDSLDWTYLTTRQAANDLHRIVEVFKSLYQKKWINTGISKGGQTAIYHRYYYPNDVDISVPYVAPLNFGVEDSRLVKFINNVGSTSCRKKIFNYQRRLLERREELLPLMKWYCIGKGQKFAIGRKVAYEYAVLEYSFSFWQWGKDCRDVPDETASADEMLQHLIDVVGFYLYSNEGVKYYEPFFYQAMTELGYYGFDLAGFQHLLKYAPQPTNRTFAPMPNLPFDADLNKNVKKWLRKSGDRFLYIYGELDTWSGAAVEPSNKTDALKIVMKNRAHHNARIKNMTTSNQQKTLETLQKWLNE